MVLPDWTFPGQDQDTVRGERWEWPQALAVARPGARYRLARIPFSVAASRCRELGCAQGDVVACRDNHDGLLRLEQSDGTQIELERDVAWFVQVEAVP